MVKKLSSLVMVLLTITILSNLVLAESDCLHYYYGEDCKDCLEVNAHLEQLQEKYPELKIEKFEVYLNSKNSANLEKLFAAHEVSKESQGLPVIFMPGNYFVGKKSTINLLEGRILDNENENCPSSEEEEVIGITGEKEPADVLNTLTFATVTGSALKDSFKPGGIAILLIMLALIAVIKDEDIMLKRGGQLIAASYLAYLLHGFGLIGWFRDSQAYYLFYKIIGLIVLITGIIRIKIFLGTWQKLVKTFDENFKKNVKKFFSYYQSTTGVILIGFLSALFTFDRLSPIFNTLQNLLNVSRWSALPLMLFYCFILLLPLIIIIAVLRLIREKQQEEVKEDGKEISDNKKKSLIKHHHKIFKFGVSAAMVVVGLVLLFV